MKNVVLNFQWARTILKNVVLNFQIFLGLGNTTITTFYKIGPVRNIRPKSIKKFVKYRGQNIKSTKTDVPTCEKMAKKLIPENCGKLWPKFTVILSTGRSWTIKYVYDRRGGEMSRNEGDYL